MPEKWKKDFDLILAGKGYEVSKEYVNHVKAVYPKLSEEGIIDKIFGEASEE